MSIAFWQHRCLECTCALNLLHMIQELCPLATWYCTFVPVCPQIQFNWVLVKFKDIVISKCWCLGNLLARWIIVSFLFLQERCLRDIYSVEVEFGSAQEDKKQINPRREKRCRPKSCLSRRLSVLLNLPSLTYIVYTAKYAFCLYFLLNRVLK